MAASKILTNGGLCLLLMSSNRAQFTNRLRKCLLCARDKQPRKLYVYLLNDQEIHRPQSKKLISPSIQSQSQWKLPIFLKSKYTNIIYSQASSLCPSVDLRLLFNEQCQDKENQSVIRHCFNKNSIDWVLVEECLSSAKVQDFMSTNVESISESTVSISTVKIRNDEPNTSKINSSDQNQEYDLTEEESTNLDVDYDTVALGGTFDRLHNGHKILLTEASIRSNSKIIVGVTDESMIQGKSLHDLIEPVSTRINGVIEFLEETAPNLQQRVIPISDPYGPTILEEDIQLIVVSEETKSGAQKINKIRQEKNFTPLVIYSIPLIEEPIKESAYEESKISSSSQRMRLLGTRLRPTRREISLPFVIGLTGGIASGKSTISKYLTEVHNIPVIDCDKLGHEAYKSGTACFQNILSTFGSHLVTEDGQIDRKALGKHVFGNPEELKKLTDIVWPEIRSLAESQLRKLNECKIIVIDAAVLVEGGLESLCHEIIVMFVPRAEAIRRIQERNNMTFEMAAQRVDSQLTNQQRLEKATFAVSSLWEPEFTRSQISKVLDQIQLIVQKL